MGRLFADSKEFKHSDFSARRFPVGDYEDCAFASCNFTDSDLSESSWELNLRYATSFSFLWALNTVGCSLLLQSIPAENRIQCLQAA